MKITIGIVSYNIPQQIYYLLASIRKQCKNSEYDICIFDAGDTRPIYHKIDDAKIISNMHDIYFKAETLIPMEIQNIGGLNVLSKYKVELNNHIHTMNKTEERIVLKKPIILKIFMLSTVATQCRKDWPKLKFAVLDKKSLDSIALWEE